MPDIVIKIRVDNNSAKRSIDEMNGALNSLAKNIEKSREKNLSASNIDFSASIKSAQELAKHANSGKHAIALLIN